MIKKMNVNVLGVVENFSGGVCGEGAGDELANEMDLDFLGRHELLPDYMNSDKPTLLESNKVKQEYERLTDLVVAKLPATS